MNSNNYYEKIKKTLKKCLTLIKNYDTIMAQEMSECGTEKTPSFLVA